ncbi:FAD-dependent oxidoreductase [Burkholderia vietnamiensis]|uniref:FAD-dependent oxidoreductase n=1 Tax=Burkholderia vietnamiensis TaxID=60552 RepID=UPI00265246F7|nr:FAD-dependent oxidoreductase [Burkholderia vietnamiensis]MDN8037074.1 FAD-dependent oxidoreductase [Burkholderia vietnamiensis]
MTRPVEHVLIIGGGFSGMSAAIEFRKRGIEVDLVEIDPDWRSYGAGISLGGATLRAFRQLGILDEFLEHGHAGDGVKLYRGDGVLLGELPTSHLAGDDVPGGGAIMRPVLAGILAKATRASGANVRLGCSFTSIKSDADAVNVTFTDGETRQYDLVVGADGLYSAVRASIFPDAPLPSYTGQGVWRAVVPRLPSIKNAVMWIGQHLKAGVNPVSRELMYLFITEDRAKNERIPETEFLPRLHSLLAQFSAPELAEIGRHINESSHVVYRPLEGLLVSQPWFKERVVLIGDTVHATTPHLASGACIGIEDAIVLAEEISRDAPLGKTLQAFQSRRWERCRMVVENSGRLGEIEIAGGDKQEHAAIMRESLATLAQTI